MVQLFRGMTEEEDGLPKLGDGSRRLGVRGAVDVLAVTDSDPVHPGTGGVSVSPKSPLGLPRHRRPPEFDGDGRDPVWTTSDEELGDDLCYRPDPKNPDHGFIEPSRAMLLSEYRRALLETRSRWRRVLAEMSGGES